MMNPETPPTIARFLRISVPFSLFCVSVPIQIRIPIIPARPAANIVLGPKKKFSQSIKPSILGSDKQYRYYVRVANCLTELRPGLHVRAQSGIVKITNRTNNNKIRHMIGKMIRQKVPVSNWLVRVWLLSLRSIL